MTGSAGLGLYFAHLSDPHLTSLDGVRWRQLLNKRVLGYLSWRRRRRAEHRSEVLDVLLEDLGTTRPEHIVITGDLTHTGLPDEFHQARLWLDRLGAAERVTVVPGNHDALALYELALKEGWWKDAISSVRCAKYVLEGDITAVGVFQLLACLFGDLKKMLFEDLSQDGLDLLESAGNIEYEVKTGLKGDELREALLQFEPRILLVDAGVDWSIVADLHLGKGAAFRAAGRAIPAASRSRQGACERQERSLSSSAHTCRSTPPGQKAASTLNKTRPSLLDGAPRLFAWLS